MTTTKTETMGGQVVLGIGVSPEAAVCDAIDTEPLTQNRCRRCQLTGNTCIAPSTGRPNWIVGTSATIPSAS